MELKMKDKEIEVSITQVGVTQLLRDKINEEADERLVSSIVNKFAMELARNIDIEVIKKL